MSWSGPSAAHFSAFWPAAAMQAAALCLGCCGLRVLSPPELLDHCPQSIAFGLKKDSSSLFVSRKIALSPVSRSMHLLYVFVAKHFPPYG